MPRVRRTTSQAIDYSREQDFSDDDVFEDSHAEDPVPLSNSRRRRPRKSEISSADVRDNVAALDDFDVVNPKTTYFEKGYDPNLPHIRDRFTFMPEMEVDGSPKVELIVGRRLIDGGIDAKDESPEDESKIEVEKHNGEYEYLIKYKGVSYLHLEWKSASDLESMNKSAKNLYRRYVKKLKAGQDDELEDPDVDQAYIQPQRIIDEDEHELIVELNDEELVEWEKEREKERDGDSDEDNESLESNRIENMVTPDSALENAKKTGETHLYFFFLNMTQQINENSLLAFCVYKVTV